MTCSDQRINRAASPSTTGGQTSYADSNPGTVRHWFAMDFDASPWTCHVLGALRLALLLNPVSGFFVRSCFS